MNTTPKNQQKVDETYTIMLIPHRGQQPKSISFRVSRLKKYGKVLAGIATVGLCLALHSTYVVYQAHSEQAELSAYRADACQQAEKLEQLQKEAEVMQQKMSELAKLEAEINKALGKPVPKEEPKPSPITKNESLGGFFGKGGPEININMLDVYAAQSKNLQAEMEAKETKLTSLLGELQEHNRRIAATPDRWPCTGRITSYYGGRQSPFGKGRVWHDGLDIANNYGVPIYASGAGVIKYCGWFYGYGRYIKINHGYGYETAYAHMAKFNVKNGQRVKKGDIIGYMGSSGYSTGPHLHFEILKHGKSVNPMNILK